MSISQLTRRELLGRSGWNNRGGCARRPQALEPYPANLACILSHNVPHLLLLRQCWLSLAGWMETPWRQLLVHLARPAARRDHLRSHHHHFHRIQQLAPGRRLFGAFWRRAYVGDELELRLGLKLGLWSKRFFLVPFIKNPSLIQAQ